MREEPVRFIEKLSEQVEVLRQDETFSHCVVCDTTKADATIYHVDTGGLAWTDEQRVMYWLDGEFHMCEYCLREVESLW